MFVTWDKNKMVQYKEIQRNEVQSKEVQSKDGMKARAYLGATLNS